MAEKEHREERRLKLMIERYNTDVERWREWAKAGNRPMFSVPLSDEEQIARYNNPTTRVLIEKDILDKEGPAALKKYREQMGKLMVRTLRR